MERDGNMKTLLDSVHGTIEIPKEYFTKIIDSPYFQRLRRIEQNSCRSVFPSARHDRFIHSIGVYHLGHRIATHVWNNFGEGKNMLPENAKGILKTYELSCLLHDVGHTPFSHTFEEFFDSDLAMNKLCKILESEEIKVQGQRQKQAAQHEIISAYVAVSVFKDKFSPEERINWELLARMITGYKYLDTDTNQPNGSFENVMIELIHGDIIDADGLDYVCRDVWAGGYKNFSIDLNRLIQSIFIVKNEHNKYYVCYKSKALNEIETVLNVKNFQYLYVIKHHKVLLEQYYLVEAMKHTACYHLELPDDTEDKRDNALRTLCSTDIFLSEKILPVSEYKLTRPIDDDFVVLMKLVKKEVPYIQYWFSRQFPHIPLWKSKMEFFNVFKPVLSSLSSKTIENLNIYLESSECKEYLCRELNMREDEIIVVDVKPKVRKLDANSINVLLNKELIPFSELNHDMFSVIGSKQKFCFFYVDMTRWGIQDKEKHIELIIQNLKDFVSKKIRDSWGK